MADKELDHPEKNKVIEKIGVSYWSHRAVVVSRAKGKKVRICGNFQAGINRFSKIDDHALKNIYRVVSKSVFRE